MWGVGYRRRQFIAKKVLWSILNFMGELKASFNSNNDLYQANLAECVAVW
jgi:hypothetical protein